MPRLGVVIVGLVYLVCGCGVDVRGSNGVEVEDRVVRITKERRESVVRVIGVKKVGEVEDMEVASGFFISRDGLVLTVGSVVEKGIKELYVNYRNRYYRVEVIGHDVGLNVALLKVIEGVREGFPAVMIDREVVELPEVGSFVLGVTCKMGCEAGPSLGMVSGVRGSFLKKLFPTSFLMTSIPVDGGEVGSAVFNLQGGFVGMMVSSVEGARSSFVVPAKALLRVRDDLLFSGRVSYVYLGVEVDNEASMVSEKYVYIGKVESGSPAEIAGIKKGDAIVEFNGRLVKSISDLQNFVFFSRPNQNYPIKLLRNGKEVAVTVLAGEARKSPFEAEAATPQE